MPSTPTSSSAPTPDSAQESRLRAAIDANSLKFHIKTGNAKWACTVMDRTSYERQKATRTDSGTSTSSSSSLSSTGSK